MLTIPLSAELKKLTRQQIQTLASSCAQDIAASAKVDYITAWNRAKALYPSVFAAMDALPPLPDNTTVLPNARPVTMSEENRATLGLSPQATLDEWQTAWKACNGNPATADHQTVFNALSDATAKSAKISSADADKRVTARHPELARKAVVASANAAANRAQSANPFQALMRKSAA